MHLAAVPAHLIVLVVCLISESLAKNSPMDVVLASLLFVKLIKKKPQAYAILSVRLDGVVMAQFAGDLALKVCLNVELYVLQME